MKLMITIGITIFGTVGGWLGALLTNNNWFSALSIILGVFGSFFGVWAGYKAGQYLGL